MQKVFAFRQKKSKSYIPDLPESFWGWKVRFKITGQHGLKLHHQKHQDYGVVYRSLEASFDDGLIWTSRFSYHIGFFLWFKRFNKPEFIINSLPRGDGNDFLFAFANFRIVAFPSRKITNYAILARKCLLHIWIHAGPFAEVDLIFQVFDVVENHID